VFLEILGTVKEDYERISLEKLVHGLTVSLLTKVEIFDMVGYYCKTQQIV